MAIKDPTRREPVTCSICGKTYEICRARLMELKRLHKPIICRQCNHEYLRTIMKRRTSIDSYEDPTPNGRFCKDCGCALWGGWWLRCPVCLSIREMANDCTAEFTGYVINLKRG